METFYYRKLKVVLNMDLSVSLNFKGGSAILTELTAPGRWSAKMLANTPPTHLPHSLNLG